MGIIRFSSHAASAALRRRAAFGLAGLGLAAALLAAPEPGRAAGWFWKEIPAKAASEGSRAGSLAVVQDAHRRGVGRWGSSTKAKSVASRWRREISKAARRARISEALLVAVVMVESGGNPRAVSPAGAHGLAQLMPGTARRYGVRDRFDPEQNLRGGAEYLSDLLKMFKGDLVFALAAYNSGENAVLRHGGVPPYAETRAYVPRVLSAFVVASKLCRQPPRSPRRRCSLPSFRE